MSASPNAGVADTWAAFSADLQFDDLPSAVVHRMKRTLLDALGVAVVGSRAEASRAVRTVVASSSGGGDDGEATVIPQGHRTSASAAAFVNGTHIHAPELAESFTRAVMHVGNMVPPAAIAMAERHRASGKQLLVGMAAGCEVAIRTGLSTRVDPDSPTWAARDETRLGRPMLTPFHPVPTFGVYGSVVAAASLAGSDRLRTRHALTLATALVPAGGLSPSVFWEGATVKDLYQGVSGALAVTAVDLAGAGLTGPPDVTAHLEGLVPDHSPALLVRGLGEEWLVDSGGLHFKRRASAGMAQIAADAVGDLLDRHPDLDVDAIASVDAEVNHRGSRLCADPRPPTDIAARLSVPFVVSALLVDPSTRQRDPHLVDLYEEPLLSDPGRQALADRVRVVGTDEFEAGFDHEWPMEARSRVTIHLTSGETMVGEAEIWGPTSKMADADLEAKFRDVAGRVLPAERLDRAVELVWSVDEQASVADLVAAVCL